MVRDGNRNDFYVYALFDWRGIPRYIGKGRGPRWSQHLSDRRTLKTFVAQTVLLLGDLPKIKIRQGLTEFEAYACEHALITAIGREPNGPLVNRTERGSGPNSEQVRAWHARRTPEQRRQHMAAANKAARASFNPDVARQNIKSALAALTPEHHLAAGKRLNAASTPEKRKAAAKKRLDSTTPEQRSESARKAIASQPRDQLSATGRRRNEFITPEMRSEIGRKRAAHLTAEQRSKNAERLRNSQTKEQLSANGKKAAKAMSPEQRSERARRRAQAIGPDRLREIAMKGVATRLERRRQRALDSLPLLLERAPVSDERP